MKKIKGLLYCTKAKPYLEFKQIPRTLMDIDNSFEGYRCSWKRTEDDENFQLNGKIVAECEIEVEEIYYLSWMNEKLRERILKQSCLTDKQFSDYMGNKDTCYALHISNLKIFDEPRELSDYCTKQCQFRKCATCKYGKNNITCLTIDTPITKAPQNMMYAYDNLEMKILISIQPQELCRILNGEQTILIKKKVLKEMLENA